MAVDQTLEVVLNADISATDTPDWADTVAINRAVQGGMVMADAHGLTPDAATHDRLETELELFIGQFSATITPEIRADIRVTSILRCDTTIIIREAGPTGAAPWVRLALSTDSRVPPRIRATALVARND